MASAAEYQDKVARSGLAFTPVRPSFDDMQGELGMDRGQLTAAVLARSDFLFRRLVIPYLRVSYEDMLPLMVGADMVLTSSLAFGARLAAERSAVPWIGVVLQPLMFLSAYDPPMMLGVPCLSAILRRLGPMPTRGMLRLVKYAVGLLLRPVHALRQQIGLPPTRLNPLFDGQFSPVGAVGLYSTLLGAIRADYPQPTCIAGFAWFDSADGARPSLERSLQEFLDAGPKPLVFTLGSLVVNSPGAFYRESVAAAKTLGKRAVLLVGENAVDAYTDCRSDALHVCAYAPHSLLFPRAEAIVHHGGIGTLGQALRAGQPQLIVPFYADQLDNAARAVGLGVARRLAPRRYHAAAAARELTILAATGGYRVRSAQVEALLRGDEGATRAALFVLDRIESLQHQNGGFR